MYRANIFQTNIVNSSDQATIEFVLGLNHSLVDITSSQIIIQRSNGIHKFDIQFAEKDTHTTTHKGKFINGVPFRLVQPQGLALEMTKNNHKAKGGFTIGSINPDGFAIHFILTEKNDIRESNASSKGNDEQIQRLIDGALMSIQFEAHQKFTEVTKRMIQLIKASPSKLRNFSKGTELAEIMKDNLHVYESSEQDTIKKI